MISKAVIVYKDYYNSIGTNKTVGGIQTYICSLITVFNELDISLDLIQSAEKAFEISEDHSKVIGVTGNKVSAIKKCIENSYNLDTTLIIFASEPYSYKNKYPHSLCIQHGIVWDSEINKFKIPFCNRAYWLLRILKVLHNLKKHRMYVHVDLNFLNWIRTFNWNSKFRTFYIPNFSAIHSSIEDIEKKCLTFSTKKPIKILFPRRFRIERGAAFLPAIYAALTEKKINFRLSIVGEGELLPYLQHEFSNSPNVEIYQVESVHKMFSIYQDHHIVLIPSISSEGTSIAGIEGMATGCIVIASNIGGLGNIVIDNYNGFLCSPGDVNEIVNRIEEVVNNPERVRQIIRRAYNIYQNAFHFDRWKEMWKNTLKEIISN